MKSILLATAFLSVSMSALASASERVQERADLLAGAQIPALDCVSDLTKSGRFVSIKGAAPSFSITVLGIDEKLEADYAVTAQREIETGVEMTLTRVTGKLPAVIMLIFNSQTPHYSFKGFPEAVEINPQHCS